VSSFWGSLQTARLTPHILESKGLGSEIHIVVGIDLLGTPVEALQEILAWGVDSRVFKNPKPGHTFHPKLYLFEATGQRAEMFIGSSNLTDGGLYSNHEVNIRLQFDLKQDNASYLILRGSLEHYLAPSGPTVQPLTEDLIDILIARGDIEHAKQQQKRPSTDTEPAGSTEQAEPKPPSPFESEDISPAPPVPKTEAAKRPSRPRKEKRTIPPKVTKPVSPEEPLPRHEDIPLPIHRGALIWEKRNLPRSDVQRTQAVTGGLRLTQAGWKLNDEAIDQTTYFRNTLFGQLEWTVGNLAPKKREAVEVTFHVTILGKTYGEQKLVISHKPSGEAGQSNYTTMLHWKQLGQTIQKLNLVGKTFRLYAPPEGRDEPFVIEIA
jgi:hypothetical protein